MKHREFIGEPMGDKEVTTVAGIGAVYGERLNEKVRLGGPLLPTFSTSESSRFSFSGLRPRLHPVRTVPAAAEGPRALRRLAEGGGGGRRTARKERLQLSRRVGRASHLSRSQVPLMERIL